MRRSIAGPTTRSIRHLIVLVIIGALLASSACAARFAVAGASVAYPSDDVRLAGALYEPPGAGPFPAVVMVHGAGPAIHDDPWFRVHANAFVRRGFAVLLYDKRGSGQSTGRLEEADYDDLARDALAGVRFLRSRPEIAPMEIGVLGLSEGGWVGPLAARRDSTLAFVIMCSGSTVRPLEQVEYWTRTGMRARGAPDSLIARAWSLKRAVWDYYADVARDSIVARGPAGLARHDTLARALRAFEAYAPHMMTGLASPARRPIGFFRANANMMSHDPIATLDALRSPVLELLGADDVTVDPATSAAVLERYRSRGRDVTVRVFPGVGHSLTRFSRIEPLGEGRFPEGYMSFVTDWAVARVGRIRGTS
ncbi:MAG: alpha/beta hydrolase [Gemmatimonadetes bacterium]|nr:alpha/beta hydrolase [Gemmatimonadota bacterium]